MCARTNYSDEIAECSYWPHDDMNLKRINHIIFIFEAAILPEKIESTELLELITCICECSLNVIRH